VTTLSSTTRGPRRAAATIALLTAVLVGAAACATSESAGSDGPSASPAPAQAEPVTLATLEGEEVTVPADKPAVMFFFTVNCGSCAQGAAALGEAHAQAAEQADFLAVDIDPNEPAEYITELLDTVQAADVPAATDTDGALSSTYEVTALGTLLIATPDGQVAYRATDPSAEQILAALEEVGA